MKKARDFSGFFFAGPYIHQTKDKLYKSYDNKNTGAIPTE
jgi:hypothetical protein